MVLFSWERCSIAGETTEVTQGGATVGVSLDWTRVPLLTHEGRGQRDGLWRKGAAGGRGLQEGHVGREEELAAAVLAEEDRQEDARRAALVKGRRHLVEHRVHLKGVSGQHLHRPEEEKEGEGETGKEEEKRRRREGGRKEQEEEKKQKRRRR